MSPDQKRLFIRFGRQQFAAPLLDAIHGHAERAEALIEKGDVVGARLELMKLRHFATEQDQFAALAEAHPERVP